MGFIALMLWCGLVENKISGQVYLLCGMKKVEANNGHYQEIIPRTRNHNSQDQFKSTKLLDGPLIKVNSETVEKRENPTARKPNLTGCPTN